MPAAVQIPVRIRADHAALESGCACLEDALGRAAGRALANSRDVVLAVRGGYVGLRFFAPVFAWTGDSVLAVSTARREELEQRWTRTLLAAVSAAELTSFVEKAERVADPLPPDPSELLDRGRWNPASGIYEIPSYQEKGAEKGFEFPGLEITVKKGTKVVYGWRTIHSNDEFREAFEIALAYREIWQIRAAYFGVFYLNTDSRFYLAVYEHDLDHTLYDGALNLVVYKFENGAWQEEEPGLSAESSYSMEFLGEAADEGSRVALFRKIFADDIRADLKQGGKEGTDEQVEEELSRRAATATNPKFFWLHVDGWGALLSMPSSLPSSSFEVIPLGDWVTVSDTAEKGKGGGQNGRSKGGKPGDGKTGVVEGQEDQGGETVFPTYEHEDAEHLECEGFEGEPSLTELGQDADRLRPLMENLANHLEMEMCEYAGALCLNAARVIASRAADVATYSILNDEGEIKATPSGGGNLGMVDFKPVPSPPIQLLRYLGAAAPLISALHGEIGVIYDTRENAAKFHGYRRNDFAGWDLDFTYELLQAMGSSVGYLFAMTCRVLLLQLLRASWRGIRDRENAGDDYARVFEQLIRSQVADLQQLRLMLNTLKILAPTSVGDEAATLLIGTWQAARHQVITMFEAQDTASGPTLTPGGTLEWRNGKAGMRDPSGYWWSREELESAVALRTSVVESIDPLVIQINADPELAARFMNHPGNIKAELKKLLDEMESNNLEKTGEVEYDPYFAFQASKIYEADTRFSGTSRSGYNLTGVHLLAHEAIADAFNGNEFYRNGIKYLFDVEMGKREIAGFFEFTGVLLLSVVCAPLGVAVGGALALYHEHEALEEQRLFKSLLNPELVITRAEVEIDLFVAELGVALAFVPEAGNILKGATKAGSALLKGELVAVTRTFAKQALKTIAREVIANLEKGLIEAFAREFVKAEVVNLFVEKLVVGPVVNQIEADFERTVQAREIQEQ